MRPLRGHFHFTGWQPVIHLRRHGRTPADDDVCTCLHSDIQMQKGDLAASSYAADQPSVPAHRVPSQWALKPLMHLCHGLQGGGLLGQRLPHGGRPHAPRPVALCAPGPVHAPLVVQPHHVLHSDAEGSLRWKMVVPPPPCINSDCPVCLWLVALLHHSSCTATAEGMCKYVCGLTTGYMAAERPSWATVEAGPGADSKHHLHGDDGRLCNGLHADLDHRVCRVFNAGLAQVPA